MMRLTPVALSLVLAMSAPVLAASPPTTRLVECGTQSCLLISGRRADASAPVAINGHAVETQGARKWRARVPVASIRTWSALHARTISVTVDQALHETTLPVGMLGPSRDLAMLVVRVK